MITHNNLVFTMAALSAVTNFVGATFTVMRVFSYWKKKEKQDPYYTKHGRDIVEPTFSYFIKLEYKLIVHRIITLVMKIE